MLQYLTDEERAKVLKAIEDAKRRSVKDSARKGIEKYKEALKGLAKR
jgi:hypothetical protein